MKNNLFLITGLTVSSGSLILDRFIGLPDWIAWPLAIIALCSLLIHIFKCRKRCRI